MNNAKKIKVVLLAGQSNMEGHSHSSYLPHHFDEPTVNMYQTGLPVKIAFMSNRGLNSSVGAFVNVKVGQGIDPSRFGPEVGLAEILTKNNLQDDIVIIKYAVGATSLEVNWRSPSSEHPGDCYVPFINFTKEQLAILDAAGFDPEIIATCYMQGESDACDGGHHEYQQYLINLIHDLKTELEAYINPQRFYFIDAGISDCASWIHYEVINHAKKELVTKLTNYIYIDTLAANLSYSSEPFNVIDHHHYDSDAGIKLGHLFGEAIVRITAK